jgi:uncharacterized protein YijF (DUF1287 family)
MNRDSHMPTRRQLLRTLAALALTPRTLLAAPTTGERLASAARAQIGVTLTYDPDWSKLPYPNGDVPRSKGVCADVVIRAARDAFNIDLQKLVHEDMARDFDAYPSRAKWGTHHPDSNIDHRRVLNLEAFWQRVGCRIWHAATRTAGDQFPTPLAVGDILTWLLNDKLPHVAILSATNPATVVHNIGNGAELCSLAALAPHSAQGLYRWPKL